MGVIASESKNIQRLFSVLFVQNASRGPTIYVHTCVHTPMNDHLYAPFAAKPLLDSTIGNGMRDYTVGKRSLCAVACCRITLPGDVGEGLHEPTRLADTSDPRLAVFA